MFIPQLLPVRLCFDVGSNSIVEKKSKEISGMLAKSGPNNNKNTMNNSV